MRLGNREIIDLLLSMVYFEFVLAREVNDTFSPSNQ